MRKQSTGLPNGLVRVDRDGISGPFPARRLHIKAILVLFPIFAACGLTVYVLLPNTSPINVDAVEKRPPSLPVGCSSLRPPQVQFYHRSGEAPEWVGGEPAEELGPQRISLRVTAPTPR